MRPTLCASLVALLVLASLSSCSALGPQVTAPPVPATATTTAPVPTLTPTATPRATVTPSPIQPAPSPTTASESSNLRPQLIRVLLESPGEIVLSEPGRRFACSVDGAEPRVLRGPVRAWLIAGTPAVQAGAFGRDENAQALVARLRAAGFEVRVEGIGDELRRVLALAGAGEDEEVLARRLTKAGFGEQKHGVPAVGALVRFAGEDGVESAGERIRFAPLEPLPVRVGNKSVRGELELRPGARSVSVINVLSLEEYLRGVVPAELGPRAFPALEALKAQAVAARTYAVAHLGEYASAGYDICDSQQCQVYEGAGIEHPLSDRAVRETEGEIAVYEGRPIDAMYHSTCGGHTEEGGLQFPERAAPYLKAVRCEHSDLLRIGAARHVGPWLGALARLGAMARQLAATLGVRPKATDIASGLVGRPVANDVVAIAEAFGVRQLQPLLHDGVAPLDEGQVAELLRIFKLSMPPQEQADRVTWELAFVLRLAQLRGDVQAFPGRLLAGTSGLQVASETIDGTGRDVPQGLPALERQAERWRESEGTVRSGSPAWLWSVNDQPFLLEVEPLDEADGGSSWSWWAREVACQEIGAKLGVSGVRGVEVTRRGISGRALRVVIAGQDGNKELDGPTVRRALALPDTLFVPIAVRRNGACAVRFVGRGWGHGVGMCQNGAYGLARGGASYREILSTYYVGVEIFRVGGQGGNPEYDSIRRH